jgi:hypothetical protein
MGRVEPPTEPHLDEREIDPLLGEPAEDHRGQDLELRRRPEAARDPVGGSKHLPRQPGERRRVDRAPGDLHPLAVRDEVRLRRLARSQARGTHRRAGERQDAALAVRAGHEGPADAELWIAELAEERSGSPEAEVDPEAAPIGERAEGVRVVRVGRHSRVRSSS